MKRVFSIQPAQEAGILGVVESRVLVRASPEEAAAGPAYEDPDQPLLA